MNREIIEKFIQGDYTESEFLKMESKGNDIFFIPVKGYVGKCKNGRTIGIEMLNNNDVIITDVITCHYMSSSSFDWFLDMNMFKKILFDEVEEYKNEMFKKWQRRINNE